MDGPSSLTSSSSTSSSSSVCSVFVLLLSVRVDYQIYYGKVVQLLWGIGRGKRRKRTSGVGEKKLDFDTLVTLSRK